MKDSGLVDTYFSIKVNIIVGFHTIKKFDKNYYEALIFLKYHTSEISNTSRDCLILVAILAYDDLI